MQHFINFIKQYITLSEQAEQAITDLAIKDTYKKGVLLIEEGKTSKRLYFLEHGTARSYFFQNGKDVTHWIYPNNCLITSWSSYLTQQPSNDYMETTEDSILVSLTYDQWQNLYNTYPELERFGRLIIEEQIALIDDFYKGYYFLTAKEKYDLLVSVYPDITQRANLGHIASMLGITQETLSRIRR